MHNLYLLLRIFAAVAVGLLAFQRLLNCLPVIQLLLLTRRRAAKSSVSKYQCTGGVYFSSFWSPSLGRANYVRSQRVKISIFARKWYVSDLYYNKKSNTADMRKYTPHYQNTAIVLCATLKRRRFDAKNHNNNIFPGKGFIEK